VERVGGDSFAMGRPLDVELGNRERFRHRYRFRATRGETVPLSVETAGMVLELHVGPPGERPEFREGPKGLIRTRFTPVKTGEYELVVVGDGLTYGNTYQLVVGSRR